MFNWYLLHTPNTKKQEYVKKNENFYYFWVFMKHRNFGSFQKSGTPSYIFIMISSIIIKFSMCSVEVIIKTNNPWQIKFMVINHIFLIKIWFFLKFQSWNFSSSGRIPHQIVHNEKSLCIQSQFSYIINRLKTERMCLILLWTR